MLNLHHLLLPASVFVEKFQAYIFPKAVIVLAFIFVGFSTWGAILLINEHNGSIRRGIEKVLEYYHVTGEPVVEFRLHKKLGSQLQNTIEIKTMNQNYHQLQILKNKISTITDIPTFTLGADSTHSFIGKVDPSQYDKYKIFKVNEVL